MSLSDDNARRVFVLQVAGLSVRYYSGVDPAGSNLPSTIATGINYTNVNAISEVGAYQGSIDPSGGVANYGAVTITLNMNRVSGDINDPHVVFGRCGARAADVVRAQLTQDLTHEDAGGFLTIDRDITSSITAPALMHIGAETVRVSIVSSSPDRVFISDRGIGDSPIQSHLIALEGSTAPELTSEITTFRGRRAALWIAQQRADGSISDYSQIINGFIEASPAVDSGDSITLSILPLTALIDSQMSDRGDGESRLLQGYHYYSGGIGSFLEWGVYPVVSPERFVDSSVSPPTTLKVYFESHPVELGDQFDPTLPNGTEEDASRPHPRYPLLIAAAQSAYPTTLNFVSFAENADLDSTISAAFNYGIVSINRAPEIKRVRLGNDELKQWPRVVNDSLSSSGPTSFTGLSGAWLAWRLTNTDEVTVQALADPQSLEPRLLFWSSRGALRRHDSTLADQWRYWNANGENGALRDEYRVYYPIDFTQLDLTSPGEPNRIGSVEVTRSIGAPRSVGGSLSEPIKGVSRAYYQVKEDRILIDTTLGLPSSASSREYDIVIEYYSRQHEEMRTQWIKATHESSAIFSGSTVGRYLHLVTDQDWSSVESFGDWLGSDRVRLIAGAQFINERPGSLLLKLLESGGGGAINGTYDVLALGLGIASTLIDESSFLRYDATTNITFTGSISGDDLNLRDVIDPLLKTMSAAIVMRRVESTGLSLISLQPLGAEHSGASEVTIEDGDWLADQPPTWDIYEDIVTQIEFNFEWDNVEREFRSTRTVNNQEAINRYGGEQSKISLDLYGVSLDQIGRGAGDSYDYFFPTYSRLFNLLSNPLRVWRGSISTGQSIYLDLGSYLTVSSPLLKGYGVDYGVSSSVAMIRSIRQNLMNEGAEVELLSTGLSPVYWNAAVQATSLGDAVSMNIALNTYSPTSTTDSAYFKAGDRVDYLPTGNEDAGVIGLTIQTITTTKITFTSPHGVASVDGTIEPTTYTNADPDHKQDGYISTAAGVLGVADESKEYS